MQDMAYKVIQWQQYFSIQGQLFIAIKWVISFCISILRPIL
jgi:hypothetical protein